MLRLLRRQLSFGVGLLMIDLYTRMLHVMGKSLSAYHEGCPSKPERTAIGQRWAWRFSDQSIHNAVLVKLAHLHSTLSAALILHKNGHYLQQAMLQRVADEANEDILFLVYAVTNDEPTELHHRFLDAFWAEEFADGADPVSSHQSRPMIPRKKIRAYIATREGAPNPSQATDVTKVVSKTYSGFVHGAASHVMECYGGSPPRFYTSGMSGTDREREYREDLWNYMYRGFCSFIFAGKAYGTAEFVDHLMQFRVEFEREAGKDYD